MTKASDNLFPGIIIRESANDGSDFSSPSADYRRLFLGEDGFLHVKDSGGTVTDPYDTTGGAGDLQSSKIVRTNVGSNLTLTATDQAWYDMDGTNLSITFTTGAHRVLLQAEIRFTHSIVAASSFGFSVDATDDPGGTAGSFIFSAPSTNSFGANFTHLTSSLTAASHTFKLRWSRKTGSAGTLTAFQTAASDFIIFSAVELYA